MNIVKSESCALIFLVDVDFRSHLFFILSLAQLSDLDKLRAKTIAEQRSKNEERRVVVSGRRRGRLIEKKNAIGEKNDISTLARNNTTIHLE